jgi:hypothetical protein
MLQSTIHSTLPVDITTDYPLYSLWLYSNRPSAAIFSACRYYNRLSYVLYSTLSASITTADYLLCFSAPSLIVNALKLHVLY